MVMAIFWLRKRNAIVLKYTEKLLTSVSPYLMDHEPLQHCTLQQNAFKRAFSPWPDTLFTDQNILHQQFLSAWQPKTLSQHNPHLHQMYWCKTHQEIFHGFHGGRIQSDGKQQSVLGSVTSSFVKDVHSTLIEPAISFSPLCNIYICGNQVPLKLKFKS